MRTREYIRMKAMIAVLTEIGGEYGSDRTIREVIETIKKKTDLKNIE